jgi:perosamine synthetase
VEKDYARNVYWMYHLVLTGPHAGRREEVMKRLADAGIETRETFIPYNLQETFIQRGWTRADACPRANAMAYEGFYLPSGSGLGDDELEYVAEELVRILRHPA